MENSDTTKISLGHTKKREPIWEDSTDPRSKICAGEWIIAMNLARSDIVITQVYINIFKTQITLAITRE